MITRSRQVALVLTAVLTAGAACQARDREPPGRSAPPAAGTGAFTLVASGDVLPHDTVIDQAAFDAGGTGYDFRPHARPHGGPPDIDLILGTHAHVPQAYQKVNGTWVIYGMGDQIADR
jgi:poly-gamma-glutamate synthesis protein (capsule biosynthesis protein)